jgi:hypothetical protein
MREVRLDPAAIAADAVALAELHGGTGHEHVRIDWLQRRLKQAPGRRHVDEVGKLVWAFGPPPYRLAVLVHVDDVFDETTARGVTQRDGHGGRDGQDMHAPTERIRADSIATGAEQLRAVLAELLELTPSTARD